MKKSILGLALALAWVRADADPYSMAIQQANRVSNQNNAEQQRIASQENEGASSPPGQNQAASAANPLLAATLQNIKSLGRDFTDLEQSPGGQPDSSGVVALMNDLSSAAQGPKASAQSVKELAKDLATALAGNQKIKAYEPELARSIHAIFNSSHLNSSQQSKIYDRVNKLLANAGVPLGSATDVVTDLQTIGGETK